MLISLIFDSSKANVTSLSTHRNSRYSAGYVATEHQDSTTVYILVKAAKWVELIYLLVTLLYLASTQTDQCLCYSLFSSPEPKAHGWANSIPLTPLSVRRLSSVHQHFQTSSPLKPLGQSNSNFIWRLLRAREQKFVQMVLVTGPRWPPCPYMVKTLLNLLLQNQKVDDLGTWYVALGVLGLPSLFKWWS